MNLKIGRNMLNECVYTSDAGNNFIFISGKSGRGKTYCMENMMKETYDQDIPVIVLDMGKCFSANSLTELVGENNFSCYDVKSEGLPIDPFVPRIDGTGNTENEKETALRILNTLLADFNLGKRKKTMVYNACVNGLKNEISEIPEEEFITNPYAERMLNNINPYIFDNTTLGYLLNTECSSAKNEEIASSASEKLKILFDNLKFNRHVKEDWKSIIGGGKRITVIQLFSLHESIRRIAGNFILRDLYNYIRQNGDESHPFLLVLDEIQELCRTKNNVLNDILTQGRKFGAAGIYATQHGKFEGSKDYLAGMGQADTRIIFQPDDDNMNWVIKILGHNNKEKEFWSRILQGLEQGFCVVKFSENSKPSPREMIIKIYDRNTIDQDLDKKST